MMERKTWWDLNKTISRLNAEKNKVERELRNIQKKCEHEIIVLLSTSSRSKGWTAEDVNHYVCLGCGKPIYEESEFPHNIRLLDMSTFLVNDPEIDTSNVVELDEKKEELILEQVRKLPEGISKEEKFQRLKEWIEKPRKN